MSSNFKSKESDYLMSSVNLNSTKKGKKDINARLVDQINKFSAQRPGKKSDGHRAFQQKSQKKQSASHRTKKAQSINVNTNLEQELKKQSKQHNFETQKRTQKRPQKTLETQAKTSRSTVSNTKLANLRNPINDQAPCQDSFHSSTRMTVQSNSRSHMSLNGAQ